MLPFLGTTLKLSLSGLLVASIVLSNLVAKNIHQPRRTLESIDDLDASLIAWEKKGFYVEIDNHKVFGIHLKAQQGENFQNKTVIVIHGFPSSSFEYSYGAATGLQSRGYDVILHDHVGFGFSDKPFEFGYSIHDHADVAQAFYEYVQHDIRGPCVFISHDMGDSILSEMLTRYARNPAVVFPATLNIAKVIFTNGGMYMKEANLRFSQQLLSSRFAESFSNLANNIDPTGYITSQQLKTVFAPSIKAEGPTSIIGKQLIHQIQLLQDLLHFKGGHIILWRLSRYLQDRYACEERWMVGLKKLETSLSMSFHFIWGAEDAVAPLKIPQLFIKKAGLTLSTLTIIEGKGHFWMLEKGEGDFWASTMHEAIIGFR